MWTDEQRDLIVDFALSRITREALVERLPVDAQNVLGDVRRQLSLALEHKNSDLVEVALIVARHFGLFELDYFDLLGLLIVEDWHISHEEIIGIFQKIADARAIPFLKQAIELKPKLGYLEYDDYGSYYKKCLWALQDIGTAEAISVIRESAASDIVALRDQAQYRLTRMSG
jgi:hypothetical protein